MIHWIGQRIGLVLWLIVTVAIGGWLTYVMNVAEDKSALLPGKTTHGHYQIEMECSVCHDNEADRNIFTASGVTNASCNQCHGESLEAFSDSHPTRKFKNPENAVFVEHINAMECVTCHREHNEKVTRPMGVTIPEDYCAHCHQVTLENLPSHKNLPFSTCSTVGCHNFHDNMALSPSYLTKHYAEPTFLLERKSLEVDALQRWLDEGNEKRAPITLKEADAPEGKLKDDDACQGWLDSKHAQSGINCSDCHDDRQTGAWVASPDHTSCQTCHGTEVEDFKMGKHGMRLAHEGLSPLKVEMARRPMKSEAAHRELSCNSCHQPHRYDRQFAAQQACLQCHDDTHSKNYANSGHARAWANELNGDAEAGTGVSCATCHMPREKRGDHVVVNHDQNANLTPNDKMLRNVCTDCHGLQFSMDALADRPLILSNFQGRPSKKHPGLDWAAESAIERGDERIIELKKYLEGLTGPSSEQESKPNE